MVARLKVSGEISLILAETQRAGAWPGRELRGCSR